MSHGGLRRRCVAAVGGAVARRSTCRARRVRTLVSIGRHRVAERRGAARHDPDAPAAALLTRSAARGSGSGAPARAPSSATTRRRAGASLAWRWRRSCHSPVTGAAWCGAARRAGRWTSRRSSRWRAVASCRIVVPRANGSRADDGCLGGGCTQGAWAETSSCNVGWVGVAWRGGGHWIIVWDARWRGLEHHIPRFPCAVAFLAFWAVSESRVRLHRGARQGFSAFLIPPRNAL